MGDLFFGYLCVYACIFETWTHSVLVYRAQFVFGKLNYYQLHGNNDVN
jgi:hypothetical protein